MVCVDNCHSIRDLAAAQRNRKSQIEVLVDINIGLNRCGVVPGQAALDLARYALEHGLAVRGIMGYDGHLQAVPPSPERDEIVRQGSKAIVESAALLESAGIPAPIRSTGGTGTYAVSGDYPGITEIQAGSYLLMDNIYVSRGAPFQRSLTVLATVISTRGARACGAGLRREGGQRRTRPAHVERCARCAPDSAACRARDYRARSPVSHRSRPGKRSRCGCTTAMRPSICIRKCMESAMANLKKSSPSNTDSRPRNLHGDTAPQQPAFRAG